jgi:phenylacetate-CoA ligase
MDLYAPLLAKALFPAFEAMRGRPTVGLLEYLHATERWSADALRDLQVGFLRRLVHHAYMHTQHYREAMDAVELRPEDFTDVSVLQRLPLLDRETTRATHDARRALGGPRIAITKTSSGTTGEPITVQYNEESRFWRDATRWRGYGWAGYEIGHRAMHYWGFGPPVTSWIKRNKIKLDRMLKRDLYVDCTPRGDAALYDAVAQLEQFQPHVMVAYAAGAAALARFVNRHDLREWNDIPVIVGAERLWPEDRAEIVKAFGPAFETYGSREVMLMGAECGMHDGLHTSMETMIVELIVREGDRTRSARPGETGEVVVTDLHNLAVPLIRYVTGDLAVAHAEERCPCGRGLVKIGPIEGRVTETMHDGNGNPVSGMVFSILIALLGNETKQFQIIQHADKRITMKVVVDGAPELKASTQQALRDWVVKYLPGIPFTIQHVAEIPLTAAGKRKIVIIEK